jgi:NDP-sugar pyrophosphorylase family protein
MEDGQRYTMESSPEYYFDLKNFKFKHIFKEPVWETLKGMKSVFDTMDATIFPDVPENTSVKGKVHIGKGTQIGESVVIHGPTYIGENCDIRPGAFIRGNVIIGDNCVVGHSTEVKGSIMLDRSKAPHFNYIGDSILGNETNIGAGVKLANVKNLRDEVKPGMSKLGAIIGDRSQLGCNTVTNPGSLIGKDVLVYPNSTTRGFIKSNSVVKTRSDQQIVDRS